MILITGGAAQGKLKFVTENFRPNVIINGIDCDFSMLKNVECMINYHLLIKRLMLENADTAAFTKKFCVKNQNAVIIMNEVGSGIIPMEKSEREWRENVGKCGCIIAERADTVIRMTCGIPTVIKGKLT